MGSKSNSNVYIIFKFDGRSDIMEKGKSCKNLREKMLFLMCLGTLAGNMGTEVYAQDNIPILDFSTSGITASNKSEEYNDTDLIINRPEENMLYIVNPQLLWEHLQLL